MVTQVRDCDWEQFKNRFFCDNSVHVIETLPVLNSDDLDDQMEREQIKRIPKGWPGGVIYETTRQRLGRRMERIRINSPHILSFLATATEESALFEKPHVFLRPFRFLIHFHEELEREFQLQFLPPEQQSKPTLESHADSDSEDILWDHVKCYMEFARTKLIAPFCSFENLGFSDHPKIRYEDLWSLFRVGELVFEQLDVTSIKKTEGAKDEKARPGSSQQQGIPRLWRVCSITPESVDWVVSNLNENPPNATQLPFWILACRLDWDGDSESFSAENESWQFGRFDGQNEILFHPDFQDILERLRARGHRHLALEYDGWTLSVNPAGWLIKDEYVSSDVIVDFKEATQRDWFQLTWMVEQVHEDVVVDDAITSVQWANLAKTDDFLFYHTVRVVETTGVKKTLLPERLFVYSIKDRKFINANITCIRRPKPIQDPFHHKHLIRATVQDHLERKRVERELDFIRHKGKGLTFLLHGAPGTGKTATAEAVASSHSKPLYSLGCGDLGTDPSTVESSLSEIFRLANLWDSVLLLDEADIFLSHRAKTDDNLQRNALVSIFLRTMEYYPGILFLATNRAGALDEALSSRVHVSINYPDLNKKQTLSLFRMNIKRSEKIAQQRASIAGQPTLIIRDEEIIEFARDEFDNMARDGSPWWNGRLIRNAFQVAMSLAYVESKEDYRDPGSSIDASDSRATRTVTKCLGKDHFNQVLKVFDEFRLYRASLFGGTDWELAANKEARWAGNTYQNQN
ncbi:P-loop containing nucleoside triphosphate hydrolase protein [Rhypophila decipiens]